MLSPSEIEDLITRCKYSQSHGFPIALAEHYAMELGYAGEDPPVKVKKFSPAHILHLLQESLKPKAPKAQEMPSPPVVAPVQVLTQPQAPEPTPPSVAPPASEPAPVVAPVKERAARQSSKTKES